MKTLPTHKYYGPRGDKKWRGNNEGRKGGVNGRRASKRDDVLMLTYRRTRIAKNKSDVCRLVKRGNWKLRRELRRSLCGGTCLCRGGKQNRG